MTDLETARRQAASFARSARAPIHIWRDEQGRFSASTLAPDAEGPVAEIVRKGLVFVETVPAPAVRRRRSRRLPAA
jgi:hypothetical protein